MISPALQNILDRAKDVKKNAEAAWFLSSDVIMVATALELLVKQNEILRDALEAVTPACGMGVGNQALLECAKIDEELGRLR